MMVSEEEEEVGEGVVVGGTEGGVERSRGLYSMSSGASEFLSVEKGVLSSGSGSR
jgi:hypothetical protein